MRRLVPLRLALSCLAIPPAAAQVTDRLPPNRMINSSGSMSASGLDGERRYRLAQAFLGQLVTRTRTEPPPVTLGLGSAEGAIRCASATLKGRWPPPA